MDKMKDDIKAIESARDKRDLLIACQGPIGVSYDMSEQYESAYKQQSERIEELEKELKEMKVKYSRKCNRYRVMVAHFTKRIKELT